MVSNVVAGASAKRQRSTQFRPDIQALRAVAIAAVVADHLWPLRFPGGYVGVDVFFVISGFLITAHLFSEIERTGTVRLGRFYARRVRRLLPAALLVLAVSALLVAAFLPYPRWERNAGEIAASAAYVENWFLAAMSVNYSALNDAASVAQHYWSLSVEEQFYLVWPLLMLAAVTVLARMLGSSRRRRAVTATLAALALVSVLFSVLYTAAAPAQAYFATFTRAWEFAVGGLIALTSHRVRLSLPIANVLGALGFMAIVAAVFWFGPATPFPGVAAALPVVGTAAVIAGGTHQRRLWHTPLTSSRPVQWVGDVSYALYLWHWPLIVVAPFVLGGALSTPGKIGVLVVASLLAWVTRRWVERPGQRWLWWSTSTRRALAGMGIGMVVVGLAAGSLYVGGSIRSAADSPTADIPPGSCVGPAALRSENACADPFRPAESVVMTAKNEYFYTPPECGDFLPIMQYGDKKTTRVCDYSNGLAGARQVWLVGDSHAQQWQGAVFDLARQNKWVVTSSYYGGCPSADVAFVGFREPWGAADYEDCRHWARDIADQIAKQAPSIVFTSMAARHQLVDDGSGRSATDQFVDGLTADWQRWAAAGSTVVALADPPFNGEVRDPDCLLHNSEQPLDCARDRSLAQPPDPLVLAAASAHSDRIFAIDLTDRFCDSDTCYAVVGGVPVYYDADHLNLQYVRMLVPDLELALVQGGVTASK